MLQVMVGCHKIEATCSNVNAGCRVAELEVMGHMQKEAGCWNVKAGVCTKAKVVIQPLFDKKAGCCSIETG